MKNLKNFVDMATGEIIEKPKFRNHDNYKLGDFEKDMETPIGESLTVPDESYTIRQLFERHAAGLLPNIAKHMSFAENATFDDADPTLDPAFDLADATAMIEDIKSAQEIRKAKARKVSDAGALSDAGANEIKPEASENLG